MLSGKKKEDLQCYCCSRISSRAVTRHQCTAASCSTTFSENYYLANPKAIRHTAFFLTQSVPPHRLQSLYIIGDRILMTWEGTVIGRNEGHVRKQKYELYNESYQETIRKAAAAANKTRT